MLSRSLHLRPGVIAAAVLLTAACSTDVSAPNAVLATPALFAARWNDDYDRGGAFRIRPLAASAVCGLSSERPFVLPPGFEQVAFSREGDGGTLDLWDMNTQNETGPQAGRYLYRTHEIGGNGQVSVTDLSTIGTVGPIVTSQTRILAQRPDWERMDGIVWTPWGTILAAEEAIISTLKDPALPTAKGGHVYEIDPRTGASVLRAAIGSRSHEGLRFDPAGDLYGISEASPPTGGYIYKFVPDRRGDLSSGQLYALTVIELTGDRTGKAVWLALDPDASTLDSDAEATRVGATGYGRPEDIETATSTGSFDPWILFVAITSENRVIAIDLQHRESRGHDDDEVRDDANDRGHQGVRRAGGTAFVYDYVRAGVNAPLDFEAPDNLALDKAGNLYIAEDPGGSPPTKTKGDDIWVAQAAHGKHRAAERTDRFASLTDCAAEPSGIYFDLTRSILYVNVQHRGAPDTRDLGMAIFRSRKHLVDDGQSDQ